MSALSQSQYHLLVAIVWGESVAITRQTRRKLEREGYLEKDTARATPKTLDFLTKHAPRSEWAPPKHQGPVLPPHMRMAPSRMSARMLLPIMALTLGGMRR
jgi:hypothetical protein